MPVITDDEYQEYLVLKRKYVERQEAIEKTLAEGVVAIRKWRRDLNTPRGYAAIFANVLNDEWKKRNYVETFTLDSWRRVKKYLSPVIYVKGGKHVIRHVFREHMRDYGWSMRVYRNYGLFEVTRII